MPNIIDTYERHTQMMKLVVVLLLFLPGIAVESGNAQEEPRRIEIMTLGMFHFAYPGLDALKASDTDKVDVLDARYQEEIGKLIAVLKEYRPTRIAIEASPKKQPKIDSLYNAYRENIHTLARNETEQIGFRLAKELRLPHVRCVDDEGRFYDEITALFNDSLRMAKFEKFYFHNPDSVVQRPIKDVYRLEGELPTARGVLPTLEQLNTPENIRIKEGAYLSGPFKYEEEPGAFTGVDFETSRWYSRNLRIFRNIQRITDNPDERILLIIGAGHLGLLNFFFECSPEYQFVSPLPYLRKAMQ